MNLQVETSHNFCLYDNHIFLPKRPQPKTDSVLIVQDLDHKRAKCRIRCQFAPRFLYDIHCGDEEAFLQDHTCNLHKEDSEAMDTSGDPLEAIPSDMQSRTKRVFVEILRYIFEVTSPKRKFEDFAVGGKDKEVWQELKHTFEFANKCLVLVNDNFHNYNEVTKVVRKGLNCNQKMAHDLTEFVLVGY